jgi:hypothetical protein
MSTILGHIRGVAGIGSHGGTFWRRGQYMSPVPEREYFRQIPNRVYTGEREFYLADHHSIERSQPDRNPLVGPWNEDIAKIASKGGGWRCLPKYPKKLSCPGYSRVSYNARSKCCGENMHVEWENVMHAFATAGSLPSVVAVAKSSHRSCLPCLRLGVAYSLLANSSYIIEDVAASSQDGAFHFFVGGEYTPIPKQGVCCDLMNSIKNLIKDLINDQPEVGEARQRLAALTLPCDLQAKFFYEREVENFGRLRGQLRRVTGEAGMRILHFEHFARLIAEYSACVLRRGADHDTQERMAACRKHVAEKLSDAWQTSGIDFAGREDWFNKSCSPSLPESPYDFEQELQNAETFCGAETERERKTAGTKKRKRKPLPTPQHGKFSVIDLTQDD